MKKHPHTKAFTLVELLTVIAIIAILAGLVLQTAGYIQKKAARSRAEAEVAAMSAALESYKADNGIYPQSTNVTSIALYQALTGDGNDEIGGDKESKGTPGAWGDQGKSYMEYQKGGMFDGAKIVDPFGNEYRYRAPGIYNPESMFDLWSTAGEKAKKSNETEEEWRLRWIKNW